MCKVSSLVGRDSTFQGCAIINFIPLMRAELRVMEKYAVTVGLEFSSKIAVEQMLVNSGLVPRRRVLALVSDAMYDLTSFQYPCTYYMLYFAFASMIAITLFPTFKLPMMQANDQRTVMISLLVTVIDKKGYEPVGKCFKLGVHEDSIRVNIAA